MKGLYKASSNGKEVSEMGEVPVGSHLNSVPIGKGLSVNLKRTHQVLNGSSDPLPEGPMKGNKRQRGTRKRHGAPCTPIAPRIAIQKTNRMDMLCAAADHVLAAKKRGPYNPRQKVLVPKDIIEESIGKNDREFFPLIYATLQTRRRLDAKSLREQQLESDDTYHYRCGCCGVTGAHVCPFVRVDLEEVERLYVQRQLVQLEPFLIPHRVQTLAARQQLNAANSKTDAPRRPQKKRGQNRGRGGAGKRTNKHKVSPAPPPPKPKEVDDMSEEELSKYVSEIDDSYARALLDVMSGSDENSETDEDDPLKTEVDLVEDNGSSFFSDFPSALKKIRETMLTEVPEISVLGQYVDFIENVCILAFQIYRSRSIEEIIVAVIVYIKACTKKPISESCCRFLESIFSDETDDPSPEQELNGKLGLLTKWDMFTQHKMYEKVMYLVGVAIGMTSCEQNEIEWKWGNIQLIKIPVIKTVQGAFNILDALIRVAIWVFQTGAACLEEGSFTPLLYSDQMTSKMNSDYDTCVAFEAQVIKGTIHIGTALMKVSETIKLYEDYKKKLGDKLTATVADKRLDRLRDLQTTLEMRLHGSGIKPRAMGVCFQGPSGIGKSFFQSMIVRPFFASLEVEYQHYMKAIINLGMTHDNTVFNEKRYAEIDDFANGKTEFYSEVLTDNLLRFLNSTPHVANKADLESKGRTYYNFDLVCVTCNPKHLNADKFTDHYEAILNRFIYVEVAVKPEFQQAGNLALAQHDPKVLNTSFWEQDYWEFTVKRCVVAQSDAGKRIGTVDRVVSLPTGEDILCSKLSIKQFRQVFSCLCMQHRYEQGRALEKAAEIDCEPLCFGCANIKRECICALYDKSLSSNAKLAHFYDRETAALAYPELRKSVAAESVAPTGFWKKASKLFSNTSKELETVVEDDDTQETNGIREVIVAGTQKALWDFATQPFSSIFWWEQVLGYKPLGYLTTQKVASEMKSYMRNVTTPWIVSWLPRDLVASNTYKWFVARMASGTAWTDTKKLMRSIMITQAIGLGCLHRMCGLRRSVPLLGIGCVSFNVVFSQMIHHHRAKHIEATWVARSDALTVGNKDLRDSSWKGIASVAIPITILALKALSVWNERQEANAAKEKQALHKLLLQKLFSRQQDDPDEEEDEDDCDESSCSDSIASADPSDNGDFCEICNEYGHACSCEPRAQCDDSSESGDALEDFLQFGKMLTSIVRKQEPPTFKLVEPDPKINQNLSESWLSGVEGVPNGRCCQAPTQTTTHKQMLQSLKKSGLGKMTVTHPDGGTISSNMFIIDTGLAIVPRHLFYGSKKGWFQSSVFGSNSASNKYYASDAFQVDYIIRGQKGSGILRIGSNAIPIPNQDLMLVEINMSTGRSRRHWLPVLAPLGTYPANYISIRNNDDKVYSGSTSVVCGPVTDHPDLKLYDGGRYISPMSYGECMSPIIPQKKRPFLLGFHISSNPKNRDCRCAILTRDAYDEARRKIMLRNSSFLPNSNCTSEQVPNSIMGKPVLVGPVHPKAYIPNNKIAPLGATKVRRKQTSLVTPALSHDAAEEEFGPGEFKAPCLTPNYEHFNKGLDQISEPMAPLDISLLNWAVDDYSKDLLDLIGAHDLKARPLNMTQTIAGIPGSKFIDAIKHGTSGGFNAFGRKDKHYTVEYANGLPTGVAFSDTLLREMKRIKTCLLKGERPWFIYSSCLKDEVVSADSEKVRVFQMASLGGSIMTRKYFLPIIAFLQHHPLESEIAVGLDCSSPNWEKMMNHVMHYGQDRILGFDYSKYDKKIHSQLLRAAMRVLITIAAKLGYSDHDIAVMILLSDEFCKPVVDWNGTLFEFLNSNPSGNNLTVILNSIVNSLLVRCFFAYTWMKERKCAPQRFRIWVHAIFYGDDALMTVGHGLETFNNLTYRDWLAVRGMTITPPHKDQDHTRFLAPEFADFLKRTSVFHDDFGCHVGALDPKSITRPLYYRLAGSETDEEHVCSATAGVLTEATLHGRDFFDRIHKGILNIERKLNINIPAARLNYDQRVERWHKRFPAEPKI